MLGSQFWRMTQGKVVEGIFALNKPTGISSAQALRELQRHFDPSRLFAPWLAVEKSRRAREAPNQRNQRKMKEIRVKLGHGGTLDPLATGVLIAGVGKGTKFLQSFLDCTKTYETIVIFGASTDSYDRVGKILKRAPFEHITKEMVERAMDKFRGKFMQLPPLFSALKMDGKPLYEYAREGKQIPREIQKRAVEVQELELLAWMPSGTHDHKLPTEEVGEAELAVAEKLWRIEKEAEAKGQNLDGKMQDDAITSLAARKRKFGEAQDELVSEKEESKRRGIVTDVGEMAIMSVGLPAELVASQDAKAVGPPAVKLRMTVTSGFYVRSLAHDLGEAVGSQAIMAELVRTRQGQFELNKNVLEYNDLEKGEVVWGPQVEGYLDGFSADYRPFAESRTEVKVEKEHNTAKEPHSAEKSGYEEAENKAEAEA